MTNIAEEARMQQGGRGPDGGERCQTVDIFVDNKKVVLHPGDYDVATVKKLAGVALADDLDQLIECKLVPIPDDAEVQICGQEIFIAHVKDGGSS